MCRRIGITAKKALAQISDKGYVIPFKTDGHRIVRIGLNFDRQTRNLERWVIG